MEIAVICGVLGTVERLKNMLASCRAMLPDSVTAEYIIVGQSLDGPSARSVKRRGCRLIESAEPLSFAKFNNLAAKETKADWLLLVNDDVNFRRTFWDGVKPMIKWRFDVIGAKLLYPDNTIQHCGKWFTLDFWPFHPFRRQPHDYPDSMKVSAYPAVSFACVLVKRGIWEDLGGLDETFTNGYEDDDFCLRVREHGGDIGVHPEALATHLESQTTGMDTANKEAQWKKFHEKWIQTSRIQWPLGVFRGWRWPEK